MSAVDRLNVEGLRIALFIIGASLGTGYCRDPRSNFEDRDYFVFTGFLSGEEVALYIGAANVCVLPSRISESSAGLPLKLLEYLACKRPVLCTPVPEVLEELLGGLGDVIIPCSDHEELVKILRRLSRRYRLVGSG